jgi:hypothetical protein
MPASERLTGQDCGGCWGVLCATEITSWGVGTVRGVRSRDVADRRGHSPPHRRAARSPGRDAGDVGRQAELVAFCEEAGAYCWWRAPARSSCRTANPEMAATCPTGRNDQRADRVASWEGPRADAQQSRHAATVPAADEPAGQRRVDVPASRGPPVALIGPAGGQRLWSGQDQSKQTEGMNMHKTKAG